MKNFDLFLAALGALALMGATVCAQGALKLVNFSTGTSSSGARIGTYSDASMKGTSTINVKQLSDGIQITGKITNDFPYGFAGLHIPLAKTDKDVTDVTGYHGIRFTARGDGGSYMFVLVNQAIKDYDYFTYTFKPGGEWHTFDVPFNKFRQLGFGAPSNWTGRDLQAIRFQIQTFGPPIEGYHFEVGSVEMY
jgi:hypothetical protein